MEEQEVVSHKNRLRVLCLLGAAIPVWNSAVAAEVPAGTVLAERQELVESNGSEPATLDPLKAESNVEMHILADFFEPLLHVNDDGSLEGRLAQRWEQPTPTEYLFHLRPGIKWSNGEPITAEQWVWSWQRLVNPANASPFATYLESMNVLNADAIIKGTKPVADLGVKALDAQTVQVTLNAPLPWFLQMVEQASLFIVNPQTVEKFGDKWTQPQNMVSSGAYTLSEWSVNEKLVGVRNQQYWDNAKTVINKITYLPISAETAEVNRYRAGEIDVTATIPTTQFAQLKKKLGDEVRVSPLLATYYYEFNTQKPPYDDARVRRALNMGLDKDIIADKVVGQGQTAAWHFTPQNIAGYHITPAPYSQWPREKRIQQARKLLAEAGFGPQNPLKVTLLFNTSENHQRIAIAASSMWKKNLGVEVEMKNQEWKTMLDTKRSGDYQLVRYGWIGGLAGPSTFLNNFMTHDSNNSSHFSDRQYDAAMNRTLTATTQAEREINYNQAEAILAEQAPAIPVYHYVQPQLVKPWVGGFKASASGEYFARQMYIIKH
ncbi:ABC transporter substrate-binding protein [Biostraticola tofi]|uniref:Oligopeptide transport system substrate-binding protein n=1 Tax=Biostraticola tofi TaxID=466109 RepID=A0A4V2W547_9GAMM|nr:ABC transporter substrate-binding protein [Biostraticola tofi]TCV98309.1 oligopeptide transport system substrate-binding protein [Biostraticola tofi]